MDMHNFCVSECIFSKVYHTVRERNFFKVNIAAKGI